MTDCVACGQPTSDARPSIRAGSLVYHVACAPPELLDAASEEYRAILRKGVRYFLEKYAEPESPATDPGPAFLRLGQAIEAERGKRR
ncbi:MAG TPA: hypothetical protein VMF04_00100 [Thermoplasmata archaeon]|nr:hypothetical protein [Thermoplasmata archaeon]